MQRVRHKTMLVFGQMVMAALMLVFGAVSQNNCALAGPDTATVTHFMSECEGMEMDAAERDHKSATHVQLETCHFGCASLPPQLGPVAVGPGVVAAIYRTAKDEPLSGIDDIPQTPPPRFG